MAEDDDDEDGDNGKDNDEDALDGEDNDSEYEFEGGVVGDSDFVELQDILVKVSVILGPEGQEFLTISSSGRCDYFR